VQVLPMLVPLAAILDLDTELLLNCLDGLSDDEARHRLPGGGNSVFFLAAHLADSRHYLAARLGRAIENPLSRYLADARAIDDVREWPALDELRQAWLEVSAHLAAVLDAFEAGDLAAPESARFPIRDGTRLGVLTFLVQHDAYHVGQLAFLRRQLGRPAMSYARSGSRAAG
jgi:uncharacterized damage-inducible protein DinB